jgi:hypothetical protein
MSDMCPECGAPLPESGDCRDYFYALLVLEAQVPDAAGSLLHFYTVSAYGLQHPVGFNYTVEAITHLRRNFAEALDGRATLADIRRRNRRVLDGPARVTRRPGDAAVRWYSGRWPMTALEVCTADVEGYAERVLRWAHSIRRTLDVEMSEMTAGKE